MGMYDRLNELHLASKRAVVPYATLDELPASVLDRMAKLRWDKPVVFVLYYGGTIGMTKLKTALDKKVYGPTDDAEKLLEPLALKGVTDEVQIVWIQTCHKAIDSTNGRWVHWVTIGNLIRLLYDRATGFVICGGTDTMAHMLAAMKFMFPNIGKPIIGTGAQVPMEEPGDDATNNLYFAITAAMSDLSGPFLMFGDELMEGSHVHKLKDKRRKAFGCPEQYLVGHYDDRLRIYPNAERRNPIITAGRLTYLPYFREGLKVIHLSPSTPSESILHDASDSLCPALLIITYGAGNVRDENVVEMEKTHIDCLWKLYQKNYPVVLGSPMMDGVVDSPYIAGTLAVSKKEGDGNAISGGCTTGPLLEVKCMAALYAGFHGDEPNILFYWDFRKFMEQNHVGELR